METQTIPPRGVVSTVDQNIGIVTFVKKPYRYHRDIQLEYFIEQNLYISDLLFKIEEKSNMQKKGQGSTKPKSDKKLS